MAPQASDHERFLALMKTHQRLLLKVCWAYGRRSHDRSDLFQEIIGRLWAAFGKYDPSRTFSTWMYRVALNVAIDFRRRQQRWGRESTSLDDDVAEEPVTATEKTRKQDQLRELLEQQDDADRALLLLYLEGHSHHEIGEVLGIGESNVSTRLYRLKKSLKQSADGPSQEQGV